MENTNTENGVARHRALLVLCSVLSLIAGGLLGFFTPHPRSRPISVTTPDPTPLPSPTPTPTPLRVYVCGAVANPAVYRLPPGSLVEDAIRAAGGAAPEADLERVNLARELMDQQQVYVPRVGEEPLLSPISGGVAATGQVLLDINAATAVELEALPHIGPTTARQIIEYREAHGPFRSIEELLEVPGVGPATLEEIRDWITVGRGD